MSYLEDLSSALVQMGIGGRRRRRIVAEFADHLREDPDAELGDVSEIALQFADELGTSLARRAALSAFAALAVTGVVLGVRVLSMGPFSHVRGPSGDTLALLGALTAAQVAFAAGTLAAVRAWRLRDHAVVSAAEARILLRRAGVGLAAGALATLAVPLRAAAGPHGGGPQWWSAATVGVALLALALAAVPIARAARVHPRAAGSAGDLLADLGPVARLSQTPTRFAVLFATALAIVIALAGVAADDPYDGIFRALLEGGACLTGFAALGRYLGLRR